ncbi:hypothetical protein CPT76_30180 [Paenibacillus sp. AR247]|nr:hypothetical protein CPT76_30180 [Paenibacillus sp. AR247]
MYESYYKMESLGEQLVGLRFVECRGAVSGFVIKRVPRRQLIGLRLGKVLVVLRSEQCRRKG